MQLVGLAFGSGLGRLVGEIAAWTGLLTLAVIGVLILREGFLDHDDDHKFNVDTPTGLLLASLSISLDSLGVGFALPAMRLPLAPLFGTVAVSTLCFTFVGLAFGSILGRAFEKNAERAAGIALIAIAALFGIQRLHGST